MSIRVGVNGFGRIGRLVVRAARRRGMKDVEFVAVNDLTDAKTLAHLFRFDSVHGVWDEKVHAEADTLDIGDTRIKVLKEKDPTKLPWKDLGVDVVLECTGLFTDRDSAGVHLKQGARVVCVSAPAKGADATFVLGVNEKVYEKGKHQVVSIGSCTTNSLAPPLKVLQDNFGIERGTLTTIHAYTNDQRILDLPHKDLRRARAAAMSLIPTSTGAAKAIGVVLPELAGKMDGVAIRVPIPCGSISDITCVLTRPADKAAINAAMAAAAKGPLAGILEYCTDPVVSADIVGNPHSAIVDSELTNAQDRLVKVFSWYDNEWGFSNRLLEALRLL
jgi:glyceraldehyde 3-phosphate dehydrogenase (phosphorylating)